MNICMELSCDSISWIRWGNSIKFAFNVIQLNIHSKSFFDIETDFSYFFLAPIKKSKGNLKKITSNWTLLIQKVLELKKKWCKPHHFALLDLKNWFCVVVFLFSNRKYQLMHHLTISVLVALRLSAVLTFGRLPTNRKNPVQKYFLCYCYWQLRFLLPPTVCILLSIGKYLYFSFLFRFWFWLLILLMAQNGIKIETWPMSKKSHQLLEKKICSTTKSNRIVCCLYFGTHNNKKNNNNSNNTNNSNKNAVLFCV